MQISSKLKKHWDSILEASKMKRYGGGMYTTIHSSSRLDCERLHNTHEAEKINLAAAKREAAIKRKADSDERAFKYFLRAGDRVAETREQ